MTVLPAPHRLQGPHQFGEVIRRGSRIRRSPVLVHYVPLLEAATAGQPPRLGFVVSKAVGNSVVRHRTVRRLRAQARERLALLPSGSGTVIRALPESATASSAALGAALDTALRAAVSRVGAGKTTRTAGPGTGQRP